MGYISYPSSASYPADDVWPGVEGEGSTVFPSSALYPSDLTWPGSDEDVAAPPTPGNRIRWDQASDRAIQAGLDHGVLYLNDGTAVAWNGLISVDENGGESAEAYFIDGRPFLYFPTPKEFSANIKAYTYPDEFSAVMGLVEVADGMYLDSQRSDSFSLSYRTKIISAAQGTEAGYKLHLIYKATVVPSPISYATTSGEVNPVEFSWDIQAVPVAVPGYRSTAHIVLDTRHADPDQLRMVEALLYGTGNSLPRMPSPADLLDILGFGDAIIITDNGDGTWSAEGSYRNIHVNSDGTFQIANANAVDHGDGTYTISSTS
jgi:hypothetical protein